MRAVPELRRAFRFPFGRHQVERDVVDEIDFHVAERTAALIARGMDPEEARAEAERRFGDVEAVRRHCLQETHAMDRTRRHRSYLAELAQDLFYGARSLAKSPGFTTVALLTLALGIGAASGIYSVVNGILLTPLPFPEPERLVAVWADLSERGGPRREWLSYPNFEDLRTQVEGFEALALYSGGRPTLTGRGDPRPVQAAAVSAEMFPGVLAVRPAAGRLFVADDHLPDAPPTALVSHRLWTEALGGDERIVGETLMLDDQAHTVIGVMPRDLQPPFVPDAEIWQPIQADSTRFPGARGSAILRAIGRLETGHDVGSVQQAADLLADQLAAEYPESNAGVGYYLAPLRSDLTSPARAPLLALLGAVGFVLLIACLNLANLLLARAARRRSELSVRAALGAGRGRIARQLLTESALLAIGGGGLGVLLSVFVSRLLVALAPEVTPRLAEVAVDGRVLAFAVAASVGSLLVFGLAPALRASRTDLQADLRDGRGVARRSRRLEAALVVAQVAVALTLLVGSGLLLRSFVELRRVDLGFEPRDRVAFDFNLTSGSYPDRPSRIAFGARLEERLAALPGVRTVGLINPVPLSGFDGDSNFQVEGRPDPPPGEETIAWVRRLSPTAFAALGLRIEAGRPFSSTDHAEAPKVVIVNQTLAETLFPGESPLGKRVNFNPPSEPVWREIVGVAHDVKNFGLGRESRMVTYFPFDQAPTGFFSAVVATAGSPDAVLASVRGAVAELDPGLAVANLRRLEDDVTASLGSERFTLVLISLFAGLALVLAVIGLYGLVSYSVDSRAREMGVRIALGAERSDIRLRVVGRSLLLVTAGVLAGLIGSYWLTRLMTSLLYSTSPSDPATFLTVSLLLVLSAVVASALPARRAAAVDPVRVLKSD